MKIWSSTLGQKCHWTYGPKSTSETRQTTSKTRQTTSRIAYLLTAKLWDSTKPKILPTFDVQHPVDSTSTKSAATVRQLPCTNPDTVCYLPCRSATSNTISNSAPITLARFLFSTPLNLPASATIITLLEELRPAKYTYACLFIMALIYLKKYKEDINLEI